MNSGTPTFGTLAPGWLDRMVMAMTKPLPDNLGRLAPCHPAAPRRHHASGLSGWRVGRRALGPAHAAASARQRLREEFVVHAADVRTGGTRGAGKRHCRGERSAAAVHLRRYRCQCRAVLAVRRIARAARRTHSRHRAGTGKSPSLGIQCPRQSGRADHDHPKSLERRGRCRCGRAGPARSRRHADEENRSGRSVNRNGARAFANACWTSSPAKTSTPSMP